MKTFIVGLAALFIAVQAFAVETWRTESFAPIRATTYQLKMADGTCSAVGVAPRMVLTAKHCVDVSDIRITLMKPRAINLENSLEIWNDGEKVANATIVRLDPVSDLALLSVDQDVFWLPVGDTPPRDSYAFVVGYPMGIGEYVTFGFIQMIQDGIIFTSAPVIFGNSGGGLFVIQDGNYVLVGIASIVLVSSRGVVPHVNGFVDTTKIRSFLE